MKKITLCRGLVACGKSTWSKKYVEDNKDTIRVCRDDLRNMRGIYWLPEQEKMITEWEIACIDKALKRDLNVIIDATNLKPKYIRKFFQKYYPKNTIILKDFFDVPLEECIRRDKERDRSIGEEVIVEMARKYLSKSLDVSSKEFIDSLYSQPIKEDKIVQNENLARTIIVDLDGTLCIHNGRSPYDGEKCDTDLLNEPVAQIIRNYKNNVWFFSGREGTSSVMDKTIKWLDKYGFHDVKLKMRKEGDMRKDSIVKKEMFNANIKDQYYVDFILDDRNQVVDMWRSLGLTCLQVAEGDF